MGRVEERELKLPYSLIYHERVRAVKQGLGS